VSLIIVPGTKCGDYHDSMNEKNFGLWVLTPLLPNLEEPLLIVMDSVPYHIVLEELPTHSWRRNEIVVWLQEKSILFPEVLSKLSY
jgi:hypothetical protein